MGIGMGNTGGQYSAMSGAGLGQGGGAYSAMSGGGMGGGGGAFKPMAGADAEWDMYTESGWDRPKWFTGRPIGEEQWGSWGGEGLWDDKVKQQWYRHPSWGGHVVYHPFWGWQDWGNVVEQYEGAEGPVTWQQFKKFPFEKQMGTDWEKYYGDRGEGGGGGNGGGGQGWDFGDWQQGSYEDTLYNPRTPQGQGFQFPIEWDVASEMAGNMARTGLPANWSPWYQQAKQRVNYQVKDAIDQAAEQAGLGGTRWSSALGRTAQDIASRRHADLGTAFTGQQLGALENARARQLQAGGLLQGLGQGYLNAPMNWAQMMYGMGSGQQGMHQGAMDRQRQELMRQYPEYNPWLQQAFGFSGMNSQMMPQQYQPSGFGQMLGGLGSILPFLLML
jgi:hypothetical protein